MPSDQPATTTAPALYKQLSLLNKVADYRALSVNYRVLTLNAGHIHAAAPWGSMRVLAGLGLDREVCVDAADFLGVLKTAPPQPFTVTAQDGSLNWQCGTARGRLGLIAAEVPVPDFPGELAPLAQSFGVGLDLGAAACGQSAMLRSVGLEGVQLYNRNKRAYAVASDGIAVSSCCLGPALPMPKEAIVTLKPQAAALLADVVKREDGEMFIGIDAHSLYYFAPSGIELHLNQLAPLPVSFAEKLKPYTTAKLAVPLMHDTVEAFLKRAFLLAETRREAMVEITVANGRTTLSFSEATNQTEEYYDIVPSGPAVSMPPIRIGIDHLLKALDDASHLVFDHAAAGILVLRGENEFTFAIAGPATAKAQVRRPREPRRWTWYEQRNRNREPCWLGHNGRLRILIQRSTRGDRSNMSATLYIDGTPYGDTHCYIRTEQGVERFKTKEEEIAFIEATPLRKLYDWANKVRQWTAEEQALLEE